MNKLSLYVNTIRTLRPIQIISRMRPTARVFGGKMSPDTVNTVRIACPELDEDASYLRRFDVDALKQDIFVLINEPHQVDLDQWSCSEASHLWNFNLHYFEYCIPLAVRFGRTADEADYTLFKRLVSSWIDACRYPNGDAWHPYTISLRLINWLICCDYFGSSLLADQVFCRRLRDSMYLQYRHLLLNQEARLLGNHYWENLKTLAILALYFGEQEVLSAVEKRLAHQLDEQILIDGVHFERSIMYHKIVLEGLIRLKMAYGSVGYLTPEPIEDGIRKMNDAVASIELNVGKTPFFNDAADGISKTARSLSLACIGEFGYEANDVLTEFPQSGFYKLYSDEAALVFFAGPPGPAYMLGHSHCDVLSFELSLGGQPLFVNSGTYAYQTPLRSFFRSDPAHNVAARMGHDQMLCWGAHRVARGVKSVEIDNISSNCITASFIDWEGILHKRTITLSGNRVKVEDWINDNSDIASYLKIAPGYAARLEGNVAMVRDGKREIRVASDAKPLLEKSPYSSEFGIIEDVDRLCFMSDSTYCSYEIEW